jgi:predicted ATPase
MLFSLLIQNFRALEDFHVPQLGRVNLIVGKNNSGKSSILEALRIYAQQASAALMDELVVSHDETLRILTQSSDVDDDNLPYQNFFTGREFPSTDHGAIYIGDVAQNNFVRISHTFYVEERSTEPGPDGFQTIRRVPILKTSIDKQEGDDTSQALLTTSSRREQPKWIPISDYVRRSRQPLSDPAALPVGFVPPGILPSTKLADLWDSIALTNYDKVIRDGLAIIEERVEGIAFVKRDGARTRSDERTAIIKLKGFDRPVALNSMGDGMNRVLQLLLLLVPAKGGFYLVDEFENGLHFSVQEKVWEMIFELATTNNVQVFAATHSWDCIEAFKKVSGRSPESAVLFRVGRSVRTSDKGKAIATVFDKAALANLTQMDVEVR